MEGKMHLFNKDGHMIDCKSFSSKDECKIIFDKWSCFDNLDGHVHICPITIENGKYNIEKQVRKVHKVFLPELPQETKIVRLPTINKSIYNTPIYNYD